MSSRSASENGDGPRRTASWNSSSGLLVWGNALKTCSRFVFGGSVFRNDIGSQPPSAADRLASAASFDRADTDVDRDHNNFSGFIGIRDAALSSSGRISQLGQRPVARARA